MQNLSIETVLRIESKIIKKLYDFMDEIVDIESLLDEIEEGNRLFMDDSNRSGLKLWLSLDYEDSEGKTFIQRFLEEHGDNLLPFERRLLIDRCNSYVTLCEITAFEGQYMHVVDIFQNQNYKVLEPYMNEILKVGEYLLVRIGKVMDQYIFMGDISFLPPSCKYLFMGDFLTDYNFKRNLDPDLTIKSYLKKNSLVLMENYNYSILNGIGLDEIPNSYFFDELDDFGEYLKTNNEGKMASKDISNLVEFFDHYLVEEGLTLYNLNEFNFKKFFDNAISDGFICSKESLNSYISTFKRFFGFLSSRYVNYQESYMDILDISKNRFTYMAKLKNFNTPFNINQILERKIVDRLNETAINLLINFDRYILYIMDKTLELTQKQNLKRKYLLDINDLLTEKMSLKSEFANQKDYPIINMFYHIGQRSGITSIEGNNLVLTKKGTTFLRLRDEEKFLVLFSSIWDRDFFCDSTDINRNLLDISMTTFINLASQLEENKSYEVGYILDTYDFNLDYLLGINEYLKLLGLIKTNFYPSYSWEITKLGKLIFEYIYQKNTNTYSSSLISLDIYRHEKKH